MSEHGCEECVAFQYDGPWELQSDGHAEPKHMGFCAYRDLDVTHGAEICSLFLRCLETFVAIEEADEDERE